MSDTVPTRRGRGRPRVHVDFKKACDAASFGCSDEEIAASINVSLSSWMRYLAADESRRAEIQSRRSNSAVLAWKAVMREAERGRVAAATMLLRRLERGHK
jgi:orotate phosphoribosyltransferase-like protein